MFDWYTTPMGDSLTQENQQDLFTNLTGEARRPDRNPVITKSHKPILLPMTLEQILLAVILLILFFCFVFYLGVLRGRSTAVAVPVKTTAAPVEAVIKAQPPPIPSVVVAAPASSLQKSSPNLKPYTIQLLTTKKKLDADNEALLLRKKGFDAQSLRSGSFYVVCVGRYSGKEDAAKDLRFFASRYKGCYLRRG